MKSFNINWISLCWTAGLFALPVAVIALALNYGKWAEKYLMTAFFAVSITVAFVIVYKMFCVVFPIKEKRPNK